MALLATPFAQKEREKNGCRKTYKIITTDSKRPVHVARFGDGRRGDAAEGAVEGLEVVCCADGERGAVGVVEGEVFEGWC